jgi:hypothetical protein
LLAKGVMPVLVVVKFKMKFPSHNPIRRRVKDKEMILLLCYLKSLEPFMVTVKFEKILDAVLV